MEKINWINGQSGGTPLSAENLNLMQDNAENAINEVATTLEQLKTYVHEIEVLSATDFFESQNVTVTDCYIYKIGRLINIQRLSFTPKTVGETDLIAGTVKEEYRPLSGKSIRLGYQHNSNEYVSARAFINEDGTLTYNFSTSGSTGGYIYNTTYVCKGE